jgi:hypothetical protein
LQAELLAAENQDLFDEEQFESSSGTLNVLTVTLTTWAVVITIGIVTLLAVIYRRLRKSGAKSKKLPTNGVDEETGEKDNDKFSVVDLADDSSGSYCYRGPYGGSWSVRDGDIPRYPTGIAALPVHVHEEPKSNVTVSENSEGTKTSVDVVPSNCSLA